ncbi:MAG: hypothetical protein A3B96_01650 [Candidatus Spechtbacteria bacterium RIFCSPHIGHO2_02_FULL_43_15b]|uniref:Uncharacterized protein n=1 Tax=Candidatus Spechtbacteria bacterium RIFCSPHIGHO2_01_FULL_43_30 TaxID=1802158 RepID=A0A1G2H709_9BACT|nr:MAG: hypothetical protein A2827_01350 [Candidatus Spechtbacteria bacterium RIFCSPHIGHO2_01_FULL_43_30]OGZ60464.1 MAG: hypothetical protein A3B96_01650 [Candidatus Spechtbacteria bacterium RIFCSPHIGHO2_02_FULL_43_15b]
MFELLGFLGFLGGGAIFFVTDSRNSFARSKAIWGKLSMVGDRILNGPPNAERRAEALLGSVACRVDGLRESIADLAASKRQSEKIAQEERASANDAKVYARGELKKGKDDIARSALFLAEQAVKRANLHETNAEKCAKIMESVRPQLVSAELDLEKMKCLVETIKVQLSIAGMNRALYSSISGVSRLESGGFTPTAQLKALSGVTELDAYASEEMVRLANESPGAGKGHLDRLLADARVERELEGMRKDIFALNPGNQSSEPQQ